MDRKMCLFFVAVIAVFLTVSSAMAAELVCILTGDEASFCSEPIAHEDYTDDQATESYFGYNYLVRYRVPNLSQLKLYMIEAAKADDYEDEGRLLQDFTVSWDFVPDCDFLKLKEITSDASSDIFTVSGYFPDSADAYVCKFQFIATVISIDNPRYADIAVGTKTSFDALEVSVGPNMDYVVPSASDFAKYVSYDVSKVNLNEVNSDYVVTVTVSDDYDDMMEYYGRYIRSDSEYTVNLPEWMTYEITGEQTSFSTEELESAFADNGGRALTSIVLKLNDKYDGKLLGELMDGTKARVNIPLVSRDDYGAPEILLSWDVVYRKDAEPFAITSAKTLTFGLAPGSKDIGTAEYTGSVPTSFVSNDVSKDVKFTVISTDIDEASGKGTITVNVEADGNAKDDVYENVFTFKDAKGNSDALTVRVTVTKPKEPEPSTPVVKTLTITGEPKTFSLKAGESAKTTLTASGDVSGKVTWSVGTVSPAADILVSSQSLGDTSAEISVVVGRNVAAESYSVEIKASDTAGTSASATLNITVSADPPQDNQQNNPQDNPQDNTQDNPQDNTQDNPQDNTQDTPQDNPQDNSQDNPQDTPQDNSQDGTDSLNLTDRIKIKSESGTSLEARPLSTLTAGTKAVYVISLEGTGVTAKAWKLLINGVEVDSSSLSAGESVSSSSSSWARIVSSDATSATIEAEPPSDLSVDSLVSLSVTGTDNKEYTADLGTVEKTESIVGVSSSSGGCSSGLGVFVLLSAAHFLAVRKRS